MNFVSVRIITEDIQRLVSFYERVLSLPPTWFTEDFAEFGTPAATLAIGSTRTLALFGQDIAEAATNRSAILEFLVEDVDARHAQLATGDVQVVQAPTTMPWGNRSLLLRDPDGQLVNLFTPVTETARKKFGLT
ncbi:VOC family protein [Roseateles chitinivorans]|uniref:VOC family protein n=1 Tax=Roseateles chitinivorans TaxID=2917965 RepID=UPI003D67D69B